MSSNFKKGDKFIIELGDRQLDEFEIAGTEYYIKIYLLKMLAPYRPPEKAKWINVSTYKFLGFGSDRVYKCSKCGNLLDFEGVNSGRGDANFCPNCGAEMEKPKE